MTTTRRLRGAVALGVLVALPAWRIPAAFAQAPTAPGAGQLDKLVAPIALYPDPLVAQILPASTYPVEVIEAARALASGARPDKATASQWDPSIQALLSYPTVLKMMSDKIGWTTQLGQAVAANQSGVMAAIQQVRRQAQAAGNLTSNDRQVVNVQGTGDTSTIVIEPANPQVIYVPQYNAVAILAPAPVYYGAPAYGLLTFGAGFAAGAATAYACNWGYYGGYSSVTVNNNYRYSPKNVYRAYNPATGASGMYNPATGSSAAYHPGRGTYTGYDARTGTYGAYNPSTGKYGTYDPSTGAYNKDGQTGTYARGSNQGASQWHPPSPADVGRSTDEYRANQLGAGGGYGAGDGGDLASGARFGGGAAGGAYRGGDLAGGAGGGSATVGSLGSQGGLGGSGYRGLGSNGFGGGWGSGVRGVGADGYGGGGYGDRRFGGGGFGDGGFGGGGLGNDAFRGLGGGGWGARDASNRGFGSFGGRGFGGGFRGGGFRR